MTSWVVRGIGLAIVNVAARSALGFSIAKWPLQGSVLRWLFLAVVVIAALLWGFFDGRSDRIRNPDPERGKDLTIRWLEAAIFGGLLAGALAYIVGKLPKFNLGDNSVVFEMTSGAAFTILLIFIPAFAGVALGRLLANRKVASQVPSHIHAHDHDNEPVAVPAGGHSADPYRDDAPTESFEAVDPNNSR